MKKSVKKRAKSVSRPLSLAGNDNGVKFRDEKGRAVCASKNFVLRLTPLQQFAYNLAAHREDKKVAAWAKSALDAAAGLSYKQGPKGTSVTFNWSGFRKLIQEKISDLEQLKLRSKDDEWLLEILRNHLSD